MAKKGQITMMIIIAIVIVCAIILTFALRNKVISDTEKFNQNAGPVQAYIIDCIKKTAYDGVYTISSKGGYYFPAASSLDTREAYYALSNKSLVPNLSIIEAQLGAYINVNLRSCINGFGAFPALNISSGDITANATLKEDGFVVDVTYPITITKEGSVYTLSDFKDTEVISRADLLYVIASNYSSMFLQTGGLSLTYASNIEDSFGIISTFQHFPDYTLVTLTDDIGVDNNSTYQWRFALA